MKFLILSLTLFVLVAHSARVTDLLIGELSLKNGLSDITIQMKEQVDFTRLSHAGVNVHDMGDSPIRGHIVMNALQALAKSSQKDIITLLETENFSYDAVWVSNTIFVKNANAKLVQTLAERADINFIDANKAFPLELEEPTEVKEIAPSQAVEWNVEWVGADKAWADGYTGKGFTIGVSDTGVQHTHPALVSNYRGNKDGSFNHNYNWFDGTKSKVKVPEDDNGHGIHCTGTASGGVDRKIGAAPGSAWIHCRSMKITTRDWSAQTFINCLQFFLAPTDVEGKNPNPMLRPHSTSHSYGCGASLGCPDPESMKPASEALKAAGVFMMVSAGNSGPRCNTVLTQPGVYAAVVSVGALGFKSDVIAPFSSRGAITYDRSNRLAPAISAPGTNVMSCALNGRYSALSGTSMASPLINGAIALLWEAVPELTRQLDKTMAIINKTSKHQNTTECSSPKPSPNNVYGYGTFNIYKAIQEAKRIYRK